MRQPRMISPILSLHTHGMPVFSTMAFPSLGSDTPRLNLAFLAFSPLGGSARGNF